MDNMNMIKCDENIARKPYIHLYQHLAAKHHAARARYIYTNFIIGVSRACLAVVYLSFVPSVFRAALRIIASARRVYAIYSKCVHRNKQK